MAYTRDNYLRLLQSLLPPGRAWTRAESSRMTQLLTACAAELARADTYLGNIIIEKDTRYTLQMLEEFEEEYGLPGECFQAATTIVGRRRALRSKFLEKGSLTKTYYIELAAALDYTITITEYSPFICGVHGSSDSCGDSWVIFVWQVEVNTSGLLNYFICGSSSCGDMLSYIVDTQDIVCLFDLLRPAHTHIIWSFTGPAYSSAYSNAYDAIPSIPADLEGAYSKAYSDAYDVSHGGAYSDAYDSAYSRVT